MPRISSLPLLPPPRPRRVCSSRVIPRGSIVSFMYFSWPEENEIRNILVPRGLSFNPNNDRTHLSNKTNRWIMHNDVRSVKLRVREYINYVHARVCVCISSRGTWVCDIVFTFSKKKKKKTCTKNIKINTCLYVRVFEFQIQNGVSFKLMCRFHTRNVQFNREYV